MYKRNRFFQKSGSLILYPDYGNLRGFIIIGILAFLFCSALYYMDSLYHHIGHKNLIYIFSGTAIFLILGFSTAFKKVVFDNQSRSVRVLFWGLQLKEIPFADILDVEERSSGIPDAFYIILKSNHLGTSVRVSVSFNQFQHNQKMEFYSNVLPQIKEYLGGNEIVVERQDQGIIHFKLTKQNTYQYISIQKIFISIICLLFSIFLFSVAYYLRPNGISNIIMIGFTIICGLVFLILFIINFSKIIIYNKNKLVMNKSLLGFKIGKILFDEILEIKTSDFLINGIVIYSNLFVESTSNKITIEKSFFTQRLSDIDQEVKLLVK